MVLKFSWSLISNPTSEFKNFANQDFALNMEDEYFENPLVWEKFGSTNFLSLLN